METIKLFLINLCKKLVEFMIKDKHRLKKTNNKNVNNKSLTNWPEPNKIFKLFFKK